MQRDQLFELNTRLTSGDHGHSDGGDSDPRQLWTMLANFYYPSTAQEMLSGGYVDVLGTGTPDEAHLLACMEQATQAGLLIPADSDTQAGLFQLRKLSMAASRLSGYVAVFGDDEEGKQARDELTRINDRLQTLEAALQEKRDAHLASIRQQHQGKRGLWLNLGAGGHAREGWMSLDLGGGDVNVDLRWGLPFDDDSADLVYFAHALEHFRYKSEAKPILMEVRRVLRPGGRMRLIVPDMEVYLRSYGGDDRFFTEHGRFWHWAAALSTQLEHVFATAAPVFDADFFGHKFGYDHATLRELLEDCGFAQIERTEMSQSGDPRLSIDEEASVESTYLPNGVNCSLFMEAVSP